MRKSQRRKTPKLLVFTFYRLLGIYSFTRIYYIFSRRFVDVIFREIPKVSSNRFTILATIYYSRMMNNLNILFH